MTFNKPSRTTGEITLIGTGGGYGESVVIHVGDDFWIVVDSCVNPKTAKSLPLEYLESIGVDIANRVRMIICTHWHDDHIKGISQLLDASKSASFCMANVEDRKKFLSLVTLDAEKVNEKVSASSTIEFNRCLEILKSKKTTNSTSVYK